MTSHWRERTAVHSLDATLTARPNLYTAACLADDVNPVSSTMRQRVVGDAPQLLSISSNQRFDDAAPAAPSLSSNQ